MQVFPRCTTALPYSAIRDDTPESRTGTFHSSISIIFADENV